MQEMEVDSWAGTARSITVHAAQTVTDFADASHSESAKSTTTTVLYGIFSSENSYPCTVTIFLLRRVNFLHLLHIERLSRNREFYLIPGKFHPVDPCRIFLVGRTRILGKDGAERGAFLLRKEC